MVIAAEKIVKFSECEFLREFCQDEQGNPLERGTLSSYPIDENVMRAFGIRRSDIEKYFDSEEDSFKILCRILRDKGILVDDT